MGHPHCPFCLFYRIVTGQNLRARRSLDNFMGLSWAVNNCSSGYLQASDLRPASAHKGLKRVIKERADKDTLS